MHVWSTDLSDWNNISLGFKNVAAKRMHVLVQISGF